MTLKQNNVSQDTQPAMALAAITHMLSFQKVSD
jgi:hypothetical protein